MFLVVKLLGGFPYKCVNGEYKMGFWGSLHACVIFCVIVLDFSDIIFHLPPVVDTPIYLVIARKFMTGIAASFPLVHHSGNLLLVNSTYRRIAGLDCVLDYVGIKTRDRDPYRMTLCLLLTKFLILLLAENFMSGGGWERFISEVLRFCIVFGLVLRINHDVRLLCTRLISLNREMARLSGTFDLDKLKRLRILCQCHRTICQISETVNEMHSFQVFFLIACLSLHITSQLYEVTVSRGLEEVGFKIGNVVADAAVVVVLVLACATATEQARLFNTKLYKMMTHCDHPSISYDHSLRIHILGNWKIVFTAGGIFEIGHSVFHSIIGTTATYAVMLMQYGISRRPPDSR